MNRTLKTGLLALVGAVLAARNAGAATTAYAEGDLMLGIRLADHTGLNYEVNLGNYSQFTALNGLSFNLPGVSITDITGQYGATWNQNDTLAWGIGGFDNSAADDLFVTRRRSNPAAQSTPFNNISFGNAQNGVTQIGSLGAAFGGRSSTLNSATALFFDASNADSYNKRVGASLNFGAVPSSIENGLNMTGGSVVSDLYEVFPTGSGSQSLYLGYFTFGASGASFTAAVPEPGAAGLAALGLVTLVLNNRLRRKQA